MESIFKNFAQTYDNGLVIFDAPTGIGKTTAAVNFIKDFINNSFYITKERIIYVTNLKTNLPYEELKKHIPKKLFDENCVVLKPYYEMILDAKEVFFDAPNCIHNLKEYVNFKKNIETITRLCNKKDNWNNDSRSYLKFNITQSQTVLEPEFRKRIHSLLKYSDEKTIDEISTWIKKIYLTDSIDKAKVIFLSTKRFLSPVDTFKETFYIYKSQTLLKKSIVIFDEFDSTKQIFLDNIISKGVKNNFDLISLFSSIHSQINNLDITSLLNNMNSDTYSPENIIHKNIKTFNKTYEDYGIKYPLIQHGIERKQTFIFNEENIRYFQKKQSYFCEFDGFKYNIIENNKVNKDSKGFYLTNLIQSLSYSIYYFSNATAMLGDNLYKEKIETPISREEAIKTVLSYFKLPSDYKEFIYNKALFSNSLTINERLPKSNFFYQDGFSIILVEEANNHYLNSYLKYFDFETTPEQILFSICKSSLVFALSATASIKTSIGNYDLEYLKDKLNDHFLTLNENHKQIIKKRMLEKESCFLSRSKVNIHRINYKDNNIYLNNEIYSLSNKFLSNECLKDQYYTELLKRVELCYYELSKNNNISSFIMFFNKFEMNDITLDKLKQYLNSNEKIQIFELKSENFNEEFKKLNDWLKLGNKALVYTTYNTIGTGKNIQYDIPDSLSDYFFANTEAVLKKDFDAIYLCKPTNLLENINTLSEKSGEDKLYSISNAFYQIEYLYKNYNISFHEKNDLINAVFDSIDKTSKQSIKRTIDYSFNIAQIIIQAIGRICRTKNKSEIVNIYIEEDILSELSYIEPDLRSLSLNHEFLVLLDESKKLFDTENSDLKYLSDVNKSASKFLFSYYNKNHKWTKEDVKEWKELREYVLRYPTDNCERDNNKKFLIYYYKLPKETDKYYYKMIFYSKRIIRFSFKFGKNFNCVSSKYANLESLLKNESIKTLFNQKRFATSFIKNKFIMCPVIFQSVYLGAIGEYCGRYILEDYLGISLLDVDDEHFEYFDFVYNGFYFDFKHWISYRTNRECAIEKVVKKLEALNGKKVFIINLIADGSRYKELIDNKHNIIEIPYLIDSNDYSINNEVLKHIESIIRSDK